MAQHLLKTWPQYFEAVNEGYKTFYILKNDRDFKIGDTLLLMDYDPKTQEYSGLSIEKEVTYILYDTQMGILEGYCIMGLR